LTQNKETEGIIMYQPTFSITALVAPILISTQVFGSLNNTGGAIAESALSLLSVSSSLGDTITLTSASLDPYTVTAPAL
jgi:hypothetical protein